MSIQGEHRQRQYAVHTVALGDGTVSGAASLFDTALTNGLLAIVETQWPGESTTANGFTKSASQLLALVREKTGTDRWLVTTLPALPRFVSDDTPTRIEVDLTTLEQAVADTQKVRHGKPGGATVISPNLVDALQALDAHEALGVLDDARFDNAELADAAAAATEYERVAAYIELVGDEELTRRAEHAKDALPVDLKDRYDSPGIGTCPMCGHPALMISQILDYGSETGTCFACSHTVTEAAVVDEEFSAMLRSHDHE